MLVKTHQPPIKSQKPRRTCKLTAKPILEGKKEAIDTWYPIWYKSQKNLANSMPPVCAPKQCTCNLAVFLNRKRVTLEQVHTQQHLLNYGKSSSWEINKLPKLHNCGRSSQFAIMRGDEFLQFCEFGYLSIAHEDDFSAIAWVALFLVILIPKKC